LTKTGSKSKIAIIPPKPGESDRFFFANQFRFTRDDPTSTLFFGYNQRGQMLSTVAFIVPNVTLANAKVSMLDFYERLRGGVSLPPGGMSDFAISSGSKVLYGNVVDASQSGDMAQFRLCFFNMRQLINPGPEIHAKEVASVDMPVTLLLILIREVFVE
jgi:hypothetical protein